MPHFKPKVNNSGVLLVEMLLAVALFLVFLTGIAQLFAIGTNSTNLGRARTQAVRLAVEGMEAMYEIRENNGIDFSPAQSSSVNTASGEYYQISLGADKWLLGSKLSTLPATALPTPFSQFTRKVNIEKVERLLIGLSCSGEIDTVDSNRCEDFNTRKIIVTVSWTEAGIAKDFRLVSFLTNI